MNLFPLVAEAFRELDWIIREDPNQELVYHRGIPILYFGNMKEYTHSQRKIVTAALNPADSELHEITFSTRHRFPSYNPILQNETYLQALDSYFEVNPYNWFSRGYEPILNGLNASYFNKKQLKHRVLHTDICSTVCTKKLWSDPSFPLEKKNRLQKNGKLCWFNLMRELEPNIILISVNEGLMMETFGHNWKKKKVIWNSEEAASKRGFKDVLASGKRRLSPFNVYSFVHEDLPNTTIIWGEANRHPFGNLAYTQDPKIRVWLGEDLGAMFRT